MNLKILFLLLFYYSVISLMFLTSDGLLTDEGYRADVNLDDGNLVSADIDRGGLFNTGVNFGRFFVFIGFGVGLPSDVPLYFAIIFGVWQTLVTILTIGFIWDSIWGG